MAPRILRSYLDGSRERVVWIEYDAYARRVFANDAADWLTQPTRYANTVIQAHKAIRTDVVSIDIAAAGLATAPPGDPVARCRALLCDGTAQHFVADCIDAILHKLGDEIDLVLRLPSPRDLLRACGASEEPGFDALDDVSTAVVAALRGYADKPIAGMLLVRDADFPLSGDEADAYGPILNAAHHYRWITCMAVPAAFVEDGTGEIDDVDLVLCGDVPVTRIRALRAGGSAVGGGLPPALWAASGRMPAAETGDLLFGTVPVDANPEIVLAHCAALAG